MVTLSLRVMSRPAAGRLPEVYKSLGLDYDERVLPSIGNEVLKATVANYDAAELIVSLCSCSELRFTYLWSFICSDTKRSGVLKNQRGLAQESERVQHSARRRLHHSPDLLKRHGNLCVK